MSTSSRHLTRALSAVLLALIPASSQVRTGQKIPPFSLSDQQGTTRNLASIAGPKGAMLVFYRSADW